MLCLLFVHLYVVCFYLILVLCDTLMTLSGGDIKLLSDGHYTVAKLSCDQGFSMDGPDTVVCREDGTWNSIMPVCSMYLLDVDPETEYIVMYSY